MEPVRAAPKLAGEPPEWLVQDALTPCPYLPGQTARLPLRLPVRRLRPPEFAQRLQAGDRRQGALLYRPSCPTCRACEAIRIDVDLFAASRTQRRVVRRGDGLLQTEIGRPTLTREKVALYNRHKVERGLLTGNDLLDAGGYEQFLLETCTDTIELTYRCDRRLVGVAIADRAADALSAVYCFYDPDYARFSPGTYSILKQIELCRSWRLRHLYLGLYVAGSRSMRYKVNYRPHERLIAGAWRRFD
ncbi:MAG TPA: arginyltransferase [Candidatus Kryptonia bacterium]|nr:arginyltransferase [Candidatus Kryptonia bacterium]